MKKSTFRTFMVFTTLSVVGLLLLPKLGIRLNPSNILPSINVSFRYPNASPYVIEHEITSILEAGFSTIKGLSKINSKSSKGRGQLTLTFDKYANMDLVRFETAAVVRQMYPKLPNLVSYPLIQVNRPDEDEKKFFLSYSIRSQEYPISVKKNIEMQIIPSLGSIQGVDKVEVYGLQNEEYVLNFDSDQIRKLKITKQDLINCVRRNLDSKSLGAFSNGKNSITLSTKQRKEINKWHFPVLKVKNKILFLDDLCKITKKVQEHQFYYRVNGENAVTLAIFANKNVNTISLAKLVDKQLTNEIKNFPNYTISKDYDSTEYLVSELDRIYVRSVYTLIILLLFILIVSRSPQYLIITVLAIVCNLSLAFLLYFAFDIEIQLYSLAGITISLGLVLDNCIVMVDHLRRRHDKSIFIPILAATLTTMGALSVIYFLDDEYKVNLLDFAFVIIINLGLSLLISLFLIPSLLEKFQVRTVKTTTLQKKIKNKFYQVYTWTIIRFLRFKKLMIFILILLFGLPMFMLPERFETENYWYEKAYNSTIGTEWFFENIRPNLDRYLGGSFGLFSKYVYRSSYYRSNEETKLNIRASMEPGSTVHQMNEAIREMEQYLGGFDEIKQFSSEVISGEDAKIEITFNEKVAKGTFPFVLKTKLEGRALTIGGISWTIYGVGKGFTNTEVNQETFNLTVKGKGFNYRDLNSWADTLKKKLERHPRIQNVFVRENISREYKPSYEYGIYLDHEKLALSNTSPRRLISELKEMTISKREDLNLNIGGRYFPIRFESENSRYFDIWHIQNFPIDSLASPVVLRNLSTIQKTESTDNIYKENQEYLRFIEFQYNGVLKFGLKFLAEELEKMEKQLPIGYSFKPSLRHGLDSNKEANYSKLLILIFGLVYLICAILFESIKQPFIILSVIPVSFIGVFLTFYLFDLNFDQGGLASFVLLCGITVNASIFIINRFNQLLKSYPTGDVLQLYVEALRQKIFPIIVTIISTILGFVPFVWGGQNEVFWFALGTGTIGGLIFSLVGILFYLPLFAINK